MLGECPATEVLKDDVLDGAFPVDLIVIKGHDVGVAADAAKYPGLSLGSLWVCECCLCLHQ
jgi:hypothetical protein